MRVEIHVSHMLTDVVVVELVAHQTPLLHFPQVEALYLARDTRGNDGEDDVQDANTNRERGNDRAVGLHPEHQDVVAALAVNVDGLHLALTQLGRLVAVDAAGRGHNAHDRVLVVGVVEVAVAVVFVRVDAAALILQINEKV